VRRGIGTSGIGESARAERLGERMARGREPAVGTTASGSVVTIQVVARGADAADRAAEEVRTCAAVAEPWTFGTDDATLASSLLELCRTNRRTLAVAESCTGGLVGAMLTAVAGSSDVFMGGWITYANAAKHRDLGVPMALLATHGAVSAPVVEAMARGACARAEADVAIAISGIAGPGGASDGKPVGTVWIAVHDVRAGECRSRRFVFPGVREVVRDRAAKSALQMARWSVLGRDGAMIWEHR
jgi:PncC family amidohydrolase